MIQRVQTLYLGILIILLSIVSVGIPLFSFVSKTAKFTFSTWGITEYSLDGKVVSTETIPLFVGAISIVLLAFLCLMSYKDLNRQFKLGRMVFFLYTMSMVGMIVLAFFGQGMVDAEVSGRELGLGFYLFIAGFPFSFLANIGIKRDKGLLDSLDRLR